MRTGVAFLLALSLAALARADDGAVYQHRLQRGQTMAAVARLYNLSLADLRAANSSLDPHRLEVGTWLVLPRPTAGWPQLQLAPGEQLEQVIQKGYSLEALSVLNPGVDLQRVGGLCLNVPGPPGTVLVVNSPPSPGTGSVPSPTPDSDRTTGPASFGDWELVTLADGRRGWAPRSALMVPASTPLEPQQVLELARRFEGAPYRWGGVSPNGVDCSGFVQEVFRLSGHLLPRLADEQFQQTSPVEEPAPGDLVFFSTYLPGPSHVGISLGGQEFLHASSSRGVVRASLTEAYFQSRYLGARRLPLWSQAKVPSAGLSSSASGQP